MSYLKANCKPAKQIRVGRTYVWFFHDEKLAYKSGGWHGEEVKVNSKVRFSYFYGATLLKTGETGKVSVKELYLVPRKKKSSTKPPVSATNSAYTKTTTKEKNTFNDKTYKIEDCIPVTHVKVGRKFTYFNVTNPNDAWNGKLVKVSRHIEKGSNSLFNDGKHYHVTRKGGKVASICSSSCLYHYKPKAPAYCLVESLDARQRPEPFPVVWA